jgi:predicted SAM-dependent methyltransferase
LNLGCGSRYHPDWINVDIVPVDRQVRAHDLTRGIPLPDDSCDIVYHSHLLEHLRPPDALQFMKECWRVLKPGGILRIAVPDLERICRAYIDKLEAAVAGDRTASEDYDWMLLELYDQTVREQTGGQMRSYLSREVIPNESFVYERIGEEGRAIVRSLREPGSTNNSSTADQASFGTRSINGLRYRLSALWRRVNEALIGFCSGAKGVEALHLGQFRLSGEVHQWMYDRFSLARLMLATGFVEPLQQTATSSRIPDWNTFNLDTTTEGVVVKPDSLFMEALKPFAENWN